MENKKDTSFSDDRINYVSFHGLVTWSLVDECRKFLCSKDLDSYKFFQILEEKYNFLPVIVAGDPHESVIKTIKLIRDNVCSSNSGLNSNQRVDLYNEINRFIKMRLEYETKKC